jgi:hypothetical protein
MSRQLHKRLPKEFVEEILEAFNDQRIAEEKACALLGIKRAQLYKLPQRWLQCLIGKKPFLLYSRKESAFHRLPEDVEQWLHEELHFIQKKASVYRARFNFAVLAEEAQKVFGYPFHRETIRYFALRHGYYHAFPEEKHKVYVRFVEHQGVHVKYALGLDEGEVQFKRALRTLEVGLIYTEESSPEAKGKVEKAFDYLQRRIPYLCEQHSIRTLMEARKVLTDEVSFYNEERSYAEIGEIPLKRWEAALRAGIGYLRPLDPSLNLVLVFSLHYQRVVKKDGSFSFRGKEYKLRQCAGREVTV